VYQNIFDSANHFPHKGPPTDDAKASKHFPSSLRAFPARGNSLSRLLFIHAFWSAIVSGFGSIDDRVAPCSYQFLMKNELFSFAFVLQCPENFSIT